MLKTAMLVGAMGLALAATTRAADVINVETLPKDQAIKVLGAAADDTVIEIHGQQKTKAQWQSYFLANLKPPTAAQIQALDAQLKAKSDADAKALQDRQDQDIATANAQAEKEFEALSSQ